MNKLLILLVLGSVLLSCGKKSPDCVERAFYYWKSDSWNAEQDFKIADSLGAKKIYMRFFDVDFKPGFGGYPISKLQGYFYSEDSLTIKEIVPTVYLKNENFLDADKDDLDHLADNVNFLIGKYWKERFKDRFTASEFQMDCDWTPKSKANYFYFLTKIRQYSKKRVSCTLRLYPYKYRKEMGIPPVDRVTLMCYNLVDPLSRKDQNSILSNAELALYLTPKTAYPIKMDIALPVFSWIHVYSNNHFKQVLNANFDDFSGFTKKVNGMWYEVTKDTAVDYRMYFRIGDRIKFEQVTASDIGQTQKLLSDKAHLGDSITVALYHLDAKQLSKFKPREVETFFTGFTAR